MRAVSRTYKLRLSPEGMDVLIEAHSRMIRATRSLLPWGTTLHTAVVNLDTLSPAQVLEGLRLVSDNQLQGRDTYFVGAPTGLNEITAQIIDRVRLHDRGAPSPSLLEMYLLALRMLAAAEPLTIRSAYLRR